MLLCAHWELWNLFNITHRNSLLESSRSLSFLLIPAPRHDMNVDVGAHAQDAVDDGAAKQLFPMVARRLTQDKLGYLVLTDDLHQLAGDIVAARADDLVSKVLR